MAIISRLTHFIRYRFFLSRHWTRLYDLIYTRSIQVSQRVRVVFNFGLSDKGRAIHGEAQLLFCTPTPVMLLAPNYTVIYILIRRYMNTNKSMPQPLLSFQTKTCVITQTQAQTVGFRQQHKIRTLLKSCRIEQTQWRHSYLEICMTCLLSPTIIKYQWHYQETNSTRQQLMMHGPNNSERTQVAAALFASLPNFPTRNSKLTAPAYVNEGKAISSQWKQWGLMLTANQYLLYANVRRAGEPAVVKPPKHHHHHQQV